MVVDDFQSKSIGFWHDMPTPFTAAGDIDFVRVDELVELFDSQLTGELLICGHAGEGYNLSLEERRALAEHVAARRGTMASVVVDVSQPGGPSQQELARHAESLDAGRVLVRPPYYWTPPSDWLLAHLSATADAVDSPVAFHNLVHPWELMSPSLTVDDLVRLATEARNVDVLVDGTHSWVYQAELVRRISVERVDAAVMVEGPFATSSIPFGVSGCVTELGFVVPEAVESLAEHCRSELYVRARPLQLAISELHRRLATGRSLGGAKHLFQAVGKDLGESRCVDAGVSRNEGEAIVAAYEAVSLEVRNVA